MRKKNCLLATTEEDHTEIQTWTTLSNGNQRSCDAGYKAKSRAVRPAVDSILQKKNPVFQAAVLRAVVDHPSLVTARKLAGIESSNVQKSNTYICQQSARMMERNYTLHGTRTSERRDAAEVMLTFTAPSPDKTTNIPSIRDRAKTLGVSKSTLQRVSSHLVNKRKQLTNGERGVYWALAKRKRGFSKIDAELRQLLIKAFNDHPHVIVSPNAKDTLLIKDENGEKVAVRKILT
jgi:hypothetical protein